MALAVAATSRLKSRMAANAASAAAPHQSTAAGNPATVSTSIDRWWQVAGDAAVGGPVVP
jgi:hypothetical protein